MRISGQKIEGEKVDCENICLQINKEYVGILILLTVCNHVKILSLLHSRSYSWRRNRGMSIAERNHRFP
jgi:hypothetical protein